ncbi:hypothetical protein JOS77_28295 [Chromobacterium haemolyticum]|nr:hypothetical protein JOS77_28295 [Chromobacterium haemolyticum]
MKNSNLFIFVLFISASSLSKSEPVNYKAALTKAKELSRAANNKQVYETQEEYNARIKLDCAQTKKSPLCSTIYIESELNHKYNPSTKSIEFTTQFDKSLLYWDEKNEKILDYCISSNVISSKERRYVAENAFGAKVVVSMGEAKLSGIAFEKGIKTSIKSMSEQPLNEQKRLRGASNEGFSHLGCYDYRAFNVETNKSTYYNQSIQISADEYIAEKGKFLTRIEGTPTPPYFVSAKGSSEPTFSSPYGMKHKIELITINPDRLRIIGKSTKKVYAEIEY